MFVAYFRSVLVSCVYLLRVWLTVKFVCLCFNKLAWLLGVMEFIRILDQVRYLTTRLPTIDSYKVWKNFFKFTEFLNGYEHIEVLLNPCEITKDRKVQSTIFRLHSSHIKTALGGNSKRPMERKQGKQCIIFKWSHAINWKPKG